MKNNLVYLFQTDSAQENRAFFERKHEKIPESVYFRGLELWAGSWKPDGVEIKLEMGSSPRCSLTLIELEPDESRAKISSRKYLSVSSPDVCNSFQKYIRNVIKDCDSRADPRRAKIEMLEGILSKDTPISVRTAGALRSGVKFLEDSPLIDQADQVQFSPIKQDRFPANQRSDPRTLRVDGMVKLTPDQNKSLRRCVLILDAVVRQADYSGATYKSWRQKAPLLSLLEGMIEKPPTIKRLVLGQNNSGITINFETLIAELGELWSKSSGSSKPIDMRTTKNLLANYFSIAEKVRPQDKMSDIFETASKFLQSWLRYADSRNSTFIDDSRR